jgi:glucose-6-phosphate isomerase
MINLDFSFMLAEAIGGKGLKERDLEGIGEKALSALKELKGRKMAETEFMDLPREDTSAIKKEAERLKKISGYFLLLGIGGSALGPKCILEGLRPFNNQIKDSSPEVFIYDNVDPSTLSSILSLLDLKRTAVNVISKSGSTAETAAGFMIAYEEMRKALGDKADERFVLTTDPEKGELRRLAREKNLASLSIPPGVGGRYSVLSAVGLLLAELIGIDSDEFLAGARDIEAACFREDMHQNPALLFASLCYLMGVKKNRRITVLFPYADRLRSFSEWFSQLWAESLGKEGKGLTPYPSVGTTDQHSQLQLWMEGPEDKVIVFMRVEDYGTDKKIPDVFGSYESMKYLRGHSLAELIKAEEEASELALAKVGRPNMAVTIPRIDPYHLGQLFYFFELATPLVGFLYGINPFNQPSVEEGKLLTFGIMGREGYEEKGREIIAAREKKKFFF